jgi:GNAT superfamily N-acetyltransferase
MGELISAAPVSAPEPLREDHELGSFDSGEPSLDDWLVRRAKANQVSGASRTYVVRRGDLVVGYYAIASGGIDIDAAPGRLRRNMPDPIPVVVLGRLAVMRPEQGQGLGRALLRDALTRILQAREQIGIALILVHALSEKAKLFYTGCGFRESPLDTMTLLARTKDVEDAVAGGIVPDRSK